MAKSNQTKQSREMTYIAKSRMTDIDAKTAIYVLEKDEGEAELELALRHLYRVTDNLLVSKVYVHTVLYSNHKNLPA